MKDMYEVADQVWDQVRLQAILQAGVGVLQQVRGQVLVRVLEQIERQVEIPVYYQLMEQSEVKK